MRNLNKKTHDGIFMTSLSVLISNDSKIFVSAHISLRCAH